MPGARLQTSCQGCCAQRAEHGPGARRPPGSRPVGRPGEGRWPGPLPSTSRLILWSLTRAGAASTSPLTTRSEVAAKNLMDQSRSLRLTVQPGKEATSLHADDGTQRSGPSNPPAALPSLLARRRRAARLTHSPRVSAGPRQRLGVSPQHSHPHGPSAPLGRQPRPHFPGIQGLSSSPLEDRRPPRHLSGSARLGPARSPLLLHWLSRAPASHLVKSAAARRGRLG